MKSDKNRLVLKLILFILWTNLILCSYLLLADSPNKMYVIIALTISYIVSIFTMIKVGDMVFETEENQQVAQTTFTEDLPNDVEDTEQIVVEIEDVFNDEPIVVNHVKDDEFIRLKSNGRKYSKLRGRGSKRTRARQPWIGVRKVEREVLYDMESSPHWIVNAVTGGGRTADLLYLAEEIRQFEKNKDIWYLD